MYVCDNLGITHQHVIIYNNYSNTCMHSNIHTCPTPEIRYYNSAKPYPRDTCSALLIIALLIIALLIVAFLINVLLMF